MTQTSQTGTDPRPSLRELLAERMLVLDGAMGTEIQKRRLTEADFRGNLFANHPVALAGNNDVLVLTRPDVISDIHNSYLEAGADIIETCSFSSQSISQSDYALEDHVDALNRAAARLAVEAARAWTAKDPSKPRYVAGSVGPSTKILSMSVYDDADALTFDRLEEAYFRQMVPLIEEGVDALLIETVVDTLNAKAALSAASRAMDATGRRAEIMISATLADATGRLLSGQTLEAFVVSVMHANPLSLGLNCSFGAKTLIPYVRTLAGMAPCYVSMHPNAGLPNRLGQYEDTPQQMREELREVVEQGIANIIGGCCGTTPDHIREFSALVSASQNAVRQPSHAALPPYAGLDPVETSASFVNVGERCNVAGSRKFLRLIGEKNYEEALEIARKQVADGAMMLDINMDDGLLDSADEMERFVSMICADPSISKVPLMIDSSRFEVIMRALKRIQGKCVVNSISLKEGEETFLQRAREIRRLGAAVIVMAFDENGQATDYQRKVDICSRAYDLLTHRVGFPPEDIIFDPNILTIATGMDEHADYALDYVRATRWIHDNLPGTRVSGGLSNLSFAFRGNNYVREAMHAVFLRRAVAEGMNMAIMNPASAVTYADVPAELRDAIEDVMFGSRSAEATERLSMLAGEILAKAKAAKESGVKPADTVDVAALPVNERLRDALIKGTPARLEEDLAEALGVFESPMKIITGPLMQAMDEVGLRFGRGEMFLPQVVKTARTMKRAVEILQPHIVASLAEGVAGEERVYNGKVLLATVKGDVHDIGKNIVGVVLECNNYQVVDLGVMVPPETIVEAARSERPDIVCLSGLITPSLEEMCRTAEALQRAGLDIPLMIGGATTSPLHTAIKVAPLYDAPVIHVQDASRNPVIAAELLDPHRRHLFVANLREEQERLRDMQRLREDQDSSECMQMDDYSIEESIENNSATDTPADRYICPEMPFEGWRTFDVADPDEVISLIDWRFFFHAWRVKGDSKDGEELLADARALIERLKAENALDLRYMLAFYHAVGRDESITVLNDGRVIAEIATPRQPQRKGRKERLALSDFVDREDGRVGLFATTVGERFMAREESLKGTGAPVEGYRPDAYEALLMQSVGDRLAEALAQYVERRVRTLQLDADEQMSPSEAQKREQKPNACESKECFSGVFDPQGCELRESEPEECESKENGWTNMIRPAVGYPSIPDQLQMHNLNLALPLSEIGIIVTENGAMWPQSSVAGLLISHPQARYFDARR